MCLAAGECDAQQNNIWYFGRRAGLDFNASPGQPVPKVLGNGMMDTNEGCSSICGSDGKLLFYSNGVTVYNKQHQVMLNGDGLLGNISSVQACVIIPQPGNDSIFYLFATDALENNFANGYTYSIINIKRDGGNGEVITKNVPLFNSCTERMTAVRHANGTDVWLLTNDNNSNIFRAWLVNCGGLQPVAVVSAAGLVMDQHFSMNNGMLKVSPDSKQLCQTHFPEADVVTFTPNFVQLFDFDNASGVVSNARTIALPSTRIISCEYSADSKLLYLTNPASKTIEQVEATLPTAAAVVASRVSIPTPNSGFYGIQLAPDGKIYLADISDHLGAITRPTVKGTGCTYVQKQIALAPGGSVFSLPAYINDLSVNPSNGFSYTILDSCTGRVQFNGLTTISGPVSWNWDFGDGNTSTAQNPVHTFTPAGQLYTVKLKINSLSGCGYIERTKDILPGGLAATADFTFVSKCDSDYVRFTNLASITPDTATVRYLWTFGDGNTSSVKDPRHTYAGPGVYNVRLDVITSTPCLNRSVTYPLNLQILNILASPDQEIDAGESVNLSVTGGGSEFAWSPNKWLNDSTLANPVSTPGNNITYKVVVRNDAGCVDSDYVSIKIRPLPGIYMPTGFTPNNDRLNDVIRPIITKEFTLHRFAIYNRWGTQVFETNVKDKGWNGLVNGVVQDGNVYIWVISATDNRTGKRIEMKGTFVIIR
ncbi:MAG: PKD domain-containing protein [Chitinophagaceae bacterium]|nr:PKD domain-containing protein [Chitinophagaceae bacterium]